MIKRLYIALLILCLSGHEVYSQSFMHSVGATISVLNSPDITLEQTALCYFPRFNFIENENSSVSVGAPVAVGFGVSINTEGNDDGIAFSYDLPIVADYNIGCKSTKENQSNFGGYFGVGFGYYKVSITQSSYSNFTGATYGPLFRAGMRFGSSKESWHGLGVTAGVFYKIGLEAANLKTIGFNVLIDL